MDPERIAAFGTRLGHQFRDRELLLRALTHASYANEHVPTSHQEALAFVGDAAIALVVAERLYAAEPDAPVGVLTPRRADLVSGVALARWAAQLGIGELLRLGRGEDQTGGRTRPSILATTIEAVLGVVYFEAGLDGVRMVLARHQGW
ncbi:MAG: ribonuclease III family protein [Candidatus Rokubacteria bacterium]|nr:ribonuclease III family protein [Candidatus Rokubacteria bacterium]